MIEIITLYCMLCEERIEIPIEVGEWDIYSGLELEDKCLCPDHCKIAKFRDQCLGCVGGWGDCELWNIIFGYSFGKFLTEDDFQQIKNGICPKRTNGTFEFNAGKVNRIDLSKAVLSEVGILFEKAIREKLKGGK
jgi:hypothetical protein